jgi:rSAM/selenodomain-associated transferase 1
MSAPVTFQLFAKAPVPGKVKTRLAPALSPADAAILHARLVDRAAAGLEDAKRALPEADAELWCAPDGSDPELSRIAFAHGLARRNQQGDDLGARMRNALTGALPGIAILVGSDCPLVDASMLLRAAEALLSHDAVFVPTADGGYALVGCRNRVPECFDSIAWSTGDVMRATRARLRATGTRWLELPEAWDVDTPADIARLSTDVRFAQLLSGLTIRASANSENRIEQPL